MMTTREFLTGMSAAALALGAAPLAIAQSTRPFIRWAELDVDPAMLDGFKTAAQGLKEAVVRTEPGVLAYHAVSEADNPGRIHVLEMYDDAEVYQAHVRQPHFLAFRTETEKMVTARKLNDLIAVRLGNKPMLTASPVVRVAELEIDPAHLRAYEAAVSEEIDDSIRLEPGVLTIYATALQSQRNRLRFFEIYADDADYRQHLNSAHFQKYVETTRLMIRSRTLKATRPLFLSLRPASTAQAERSANIPR